MLTDCREVTTNAGTVHMNGGNTAASTATTTANGTSSTISPTPSPVDSLNSVGSHSSGYTSEVRSGVSPSHHNSFLLGLVEQFHNVQNAGQSYELWDQAESNLIKTNSQSKFGLL